MKHRIAPLALLLLASLLYDALGLCLALGGMGAVPLTADGPFEALTIGQALPSSGTQLLSGVPLDPNFVLGPVPNIEFGPVPYLALGSDPNLSSLPLLTPAAARTGDTQIGDAVIASDESEACHSVPLPDQPTAAYQIATGLERIMSHSTTELTGLDAVMARALLFDATRAVGAQRDSAARLIGILPEVVDPPG